MQLQRSNYPGFESADTPMSKTDSVNHTQSLVGKFAFFNSAEGLAVQHKAMTNKCNKVFIVSRAEMVASLHTDRNGIYANELAVNTFYLKPRI